MWKIVTFFIAAVSLAQPASDPVRTVTSQANLIANVTVVGFHKGYLFRVDPAYLTLYSPGGNLAFAKELIAPNGSAARILGLAVDSSGTVAVSISSRDLNLAERGAVVFLDPYGAPAGSPIDTRRFQAQSLCYADDRSLWAFGWQTGQPREYMTVRKYSPEGKEVAAFLPRSLFPPGMEPGMGDGRKCGSR